MFRHHVKINLELKKTRNGIFKAFNYALHVGYTFFLPRGGGSNCLTLDLERGCVPLNINKN